MWKDTLRFLFLKIPLCRMENGLGERNQSEGRWKLGPGGGGRAGEKSIHQGQARTIAGRGGGLDGDGEAGRGMSGIGPWGLSAQPEGEC